MALEYIWLDSNNNFRSKIKIDTKINLGSEFSLTDIPIWNYDGSSTGQATLHDSEVTLIPVKFYRHKNQINFPVLVLCDTYNPKTDSHSSFFEANKIFEKYNSDLPMFGLEQEFFMYDFNNNIPELSNNLRGKYYCGNGVQSSRTRNYLLEVMYLCMDLGINLTGMNYEVAPGQAEFQVCNTGIDVCHDLLMLRYILTRVGETNNIIPNFEPKPVENENGSGCHINFSTISMRNETNNQNLMKVMEEMCKKLKKSHEHFINNVYGTNNKDRLTGTCETSSFKEFSVKKGSRGASIRVPINGNYFEDRRPGSNIDPYLACSEFLSCVLD